MEGHVTLTTMSDDTKWVVGSVLAAAVLLSGVMYALIGGVHSRIDDVQAEIRELRSDMREDYNRLDERLRRIEQAMKPEPRPADAD